MRKIASLYLLTNICLGVCSLPHSVTAQVSSDGTLSTTVSTDDAVNFLIENGDRSGSNLFHSFLEFSIPNLGSAYFNNATDITHIFSRVTGGNISDIQGLIRANGTANLFLINPAGIIFGDNASLDVGGAFFATTAESVVFGDDIEFSATQPQGAPLLTINITPGLQYGTNPASINVSGSNLVVNSGQSISLLGGDVVITNSTINAPGGQVNLGGFAETGTIQIEGLTATFPENTTLGNVNLTDTAIIDVTSTNNGTIAINAANFTMSGASEVLAGLTSGGSNADAVAGKITINATGNTNLTGKSLIANDLQTNAVGNGGNVELNTNSLSLTEGSRIQTVTNSSGASGDIAIQANTGIVVDGFTDDGLFSGLLSRSATQTAGAGGNITVNSPQNTLTLSNLGFIATVTNSSSNGGSIETNLNNLVIETGGQIVTATTNLGNAGDITINATESVNISGESRDFVPNPFLGLATFDLNALEFITGLNPNVAESETIPYVSVERTPTQIVSGTTILGAAADQVDYYSFSVTQGGSRAILDIDEGFTGEAGSVDTKIFLFNQGTGELLEVNQESEATDAGEGSLPLLDTLSFSADALIDTTLSESGYYVLGVSVFRSQASNNQLVSGVSPMIGDTYTLQVSVENQGTEGVSIPVDSFNSDNFNPNLDALSRISSETSAIGNGGKLTINTGQLILNDQEGRISSETLDSGNSGDISLNVDFLIDNHGILSNRTLGSGNSGNVAINTEQLQITGRLLVVTNASGNSGDLTINASESVLVTEAALISLDVAEGATGNGGSLFLSTPLLQLLNGGQIAGGTLGEGNASSLNITATSVEVIGDSDAFPSGLFVSSEGGGDGGNLTIETERLLLADGGLLDSLSSGTGAAGDITIQATESVEIRGLDSGEFPSGILASGLLIGQISDENLSTSGDILIETGSLRVIQGRILSTASGAGDAGNITIRATEVEVSDTIEDPLSDLGGLSVAVDTEATGQGGTLTIEADSLRVFDGGEITASSLGTGNGGSIILDVDEIEVTGFSENGDISQIAASSETAANAGDIDITANNLTVSDRAQISISNRGTGDAGNLNINAENIFLDTQGSLQGEVTAGNQGNINLNSQLLLLRNNSNITTNAGEQATGGNIDIETVNLVALEDSDITANAVLGQGGNIIITAQGLFLSPDSDITASSERGIDGVVTLNTPEADNSAALIQLPTTLTDPSQQIAQGCAWTATSSFYVTGRGGIPQDPSAIIPANDILSDVRTSPNPQSSVISHQSPSGFTVAHGGNPQDRAVSPVRQIVEANTWIINEKGNVELVAIVTPQDPRYESLQASCVK